MWAHRCFLHLKDSRPWGSLAFSSVSIYHTHTYMDTHIHKHPPREEDDIHPILKYYPGIMKQANTTLKCPGSQDSVVCAGRGAWKNDESCCCRGWASLLLRANWKGLVWTFPVGIAEVQVWKLKYCFKTFSLWSYDSRMNGGLVYQKAKIIP